MVPIHMNRWTKIAYVAAMGLAVALLWPLEGRANVGVSSHAPHQLEHKKDFASRTFWMLLHEQKELKLSADQVGKLKTLATDYAKTRIRNHAAIELAEVDVRSLITNQQSELSAIETALRTSEAAVTAERLDRVKAIRTALAILTPEQRDIWNVRMHERYPNRHQGPICGNGSDHSDRAFHQDRAVGMKSSEQSAHRSDDRPTGTTGHDLVAPSTELH